MRYLCLVRWDLADVLTSEQRKRLMSAIRTEHTSPELAVRRILHSLGYRFRLHRHDLPGKPDIVLSRYKTAIFVHGCFWHQHSRCNRAAVPTSNRKFWLAKLSGNAARDRRVARQLRQLGWKVFVIWGCELREVGRLERRIVRRLE
jgi:DNA mismatch endonuclease (patch repair protein)